MKWVNAVFIAHLFLAFFSVPVVLMMLSPGPWQGALLLGWLFYWLASIWLAIRGKKNRLTLGIVIAMVLVVLTTCVNFNHDTDQLAEENCAFLKTQCTKLGNQPLYYCGAALQISIAKNSPYLLQQCSVTKEQFCNYAKQFCTRTSSKDSSTISYKCDHDLITCP